jgi:hypothetical protein
VSILKSYIPALPVIQRRPDITLLKWEGTGEIPALVSVRLRFSFGDRNHMQFSREPSMRRLAYSVLLAILCTAAPASAQIAGKHDYEPVGIATPLWGDSALPGPGIGRDLRDVRQRIDRARHRGDISRGEARRLDREARRIGGLARRYGRDGFSASERAELAARANYLRGAVSAQASTPAKPRRRG